MLRIPSNFNKTCENTLIYRGVLIAPPPAHCAPPNLTTPQCGGSVLLIQPCTMCIGYLSDLDHFHLKWRWGNLLKNADVVLDHYCGPLLALCRLQRP